MDSYKEVDKQTEQQLSSCHRFDVKDHLNTETIERIKAAIYGQCIGDAIGLLTEFMTFAQASEHYGKYERLEYAMKINDGHRRRWETGDWTDDSDQMILLLECLIEDNGDVIPQSFASKLKNWVICGFRELGDKCGYGIGSLTMEVVHEPAFLTDPEKIANKVWENSGRFSAPNGGVMRTSIMGVHQFWDTEKVMENAVNMCTVTHYDQRCKASVVAVSVAISLMLRRKHYDGKHFNVSKIMHESFDRAGEYFNGPRARENAEELKMYMFCENIADLNLSEGESIGYTFKCVGAGFWAFKQDNFRKAIQTVVMNGTRVDRNDHENALMLLCKISFSCYFSIIPKFQKCYLVHGKSISHPIFNEILPITDVKQSRNF
ncbi:Hypothetical predicted protein, partial [Mytilus galloprovincialis]